MTGSTYLRWSSLAEKSLLCLARYWILALGTAPSAEAEMSHIGSWLPHLSFSLINKGMEIFQQKSCDDEKCGAEEKKISPK